MNYTRSEKSKDEQLLLSFDHTESITIAQFQSFASKMPAYYLSLAIMMVTTAIVFRDAAPLWLSAGMPLFFSVMASASGLWWWARRNRCPTEREARRYLARSTIFLIAVAVAIAGMDVLLFAWGNTHQRYFILFHLLFAAVSGFFCVMHLRLVATPVAFAMLSPFVWLIYSMGAQADHAVALDAFIIAAVMFIAMTRYRRDFVQLVQSKAATVELSEENVRIANTDLLTGLQNRRQFFRALSDTRETAEARIAAFAVGIIDLDGFKPVNDTYGHRVGDAVLAEIARRLSCEIPGIVHLCRVGGDEFAFIVAGGRPTNLLLALGQKIIDTVMLPIRVGELLTSVGCSIGFAAYPDAAKTADLLYERADYALNHAKRTGRARAILFSEEHQRLIREEGVIEQTLRQANLKTEFYPVFQPIVDVSSSRTRGFECLARWSSPSLGNVSPGVFIPVAERTGIIRDLTPLLLRKALAAAKHWPEEVHLSFNVSPYDIASLDRTAAIIKLIEESGVYPSRIAIEVTETALLHNFVQANLHISMLRSIGVQISLDDFGTGYSSLSYVHALAFDKIKIDRSFIRDIQLNSVSENIVRSVISLCQELNLSCIVEGVETEEQLAIVKRLGAIIIQGFIFSKPMSTNDVTAYILAEEHRYKSHRKNEFLSGTLSCPGKLRPN